MSIYLTNHDLKASRVMTLAAATLDLSPKEKHEKLSLLLSHSIGWVDEHKRDTLRARLEGLGAHAISQALPLVLAYPGNDLQRATVSFIKKDYTDGISFLGVDAWSHQDLTKSVRHIGAERRYKYRDLLQAPPVILKEARTLVAITSLLLSGEVAGVRENISGVREGWALTNKALIDLVQELPERGDEIIRVMKEQGTYDAQVIKASI